MTTIKPEPFFNRFNELQSLNRSWNHPRTNGILALVYGRRRLGKTYLLQEFFSENDKPHCYYLAEQTTATAQRTALAKHLLEIFPKDGVTADDLSVSWNSILRYLTSQCPKSKRFGLILDEFPYLVEQSPELPSILQAWWDSEGIHSKLFVVLCGSQLSAMASLGNDNAPLFGRFNGGIYLIQPFTYKDTALFYDGSPSLSKQDILTLYGMLGGTPRYHALVDITRKLDSEIVDLLLRRGSVLENEVRYLLGSQQIRNPAPYNAILQVIARGETQFNRIMQLTGTERGSLSFFLKTLVELGWIRREFPFNETTDKRASYKTADPFLAFWFRLISPVASELTFANPDVVYKQRIEPYIPTYMGIVFEEICMQWLQQNAKHKLELNVKKAGRYWSRDGQTEIDLIAETDKGYLFGECKWNISKPVEIEVYFQLTSKVNSLQKAHYKNNPRFILFSIGGFSPELTQLAKNELSALTLIGIKDLLPE